MNNINFENKIICAPMVRISSLPFRILSLSYGCDLVFTEEIIDFKLLKSKRYQNEMLGTIDYIDDENNIVFRTCNLEKEKVILQIGTCDPDRALQAAKIVEKDVSAIDINMGCPKSFSLKGGMGAALLTKKEKVKAILSNLVNNLSVPVTCKIRILPKLNDTIDLVKLIESTKVAAITVHGRTKDERPQHENHIDVIKKISESIKIPIIANGNSSEINQYDDIWEFKKITNANSIMIARAAEKNCSIFRKEGKLDMDIVIREYLRLSIRYGSNGVCAKYCIQNILGSLQETPKGKKFLATSSLLEICKLWDLEEDYHQIKNELNAKVQKENKIESNHHQNNNENNDNENKILTNLRRKRKISELDEEIDEMSLKFFRNLFNKDHDLPKSILLNYGNKLKKKATYRCFTSEKFFYAICEFDNKKYMNSYLEKNKKFAEQGAALVACAYLNLIDHDIIKKSIIEKKPFERILSKKSHI